MSLREWWRRRPLRVRLALWYAVGGTLLLASFSATLVFFYVSERMARPLGRNSGRILEQVQRR